MCMKGGNTYNFKHRECLQLHCFGFLGVPSFASLALCLDLAFGDSGFLERESVLGYTDLTTVSREHYMPPPPTLC